jgi:hypothetical protein
MGGNSPNLEVGFGNLGKKPSKVSGNFEGWRTGQDEEARSTYVIEIAL